MNLASPGFLAIWDPSVNVDWMGSHGIPIQVLGCLHASLETITLANILFYFNCQRM